jgi:hypothetical protein
LNNLFPPFYLKPMFVLVSEMCFLHATTHWILIFNLVYQSMSFDCGELSSLTFSVNFERYIGNSHYFVAFLLSVDYVLLFILLSTHLVRIIYSHTFNTMFIFIFIVSDSFEYLLKTSFMIINFFHFWLPWKLLFFLQL